MNEKFKFSEYACQKSSSQIQISKTKEFIHHNSALQYLLTLATLEPRKIKRLLNLTSFIYNKKLTIELNLLEIIFRYYLVRYRTSFENQMSLSVVSSL